MVSVEEASDISKHTLRLALDEVVRESLRPVIAGLSLLYIAFAIGHTILLPSPVGTIMTPVAGASAFVLWSTAALLGWYRLPLHYTHPLAAGVASLVLLNSLLHLYLTAELWHTTNIMLLIIGVGCFFLSAWWVALMLVVALLGWSLVAWSAPLPPPLLHFAFALFTATGLAIMVFYVRLRTHRRLALLHLQDEYQKANLEKALASAQEMDRLKDDLISTVSHELRTPLTSLLGFTELMLEREFPAQKRQEFLGILHNEAIRLTGLINDFLDLQRMESGRHQYRFAPVEIIPLLQESVAVFAKADGKHIWHLAVPESLPLVRMDTDRIHQVLVNLLSNAVKFSSGGVVTVGARIHRDELVVWVADQGIGVPHDALPHLFDKFFRIDHHDTRTVGGTGLGLALVKEIVEAHHGHIWVESTLGKGSTFFFTLPLTTSNERALPR
ncbi:MAG: sensor histidine kinase [Candidatus Binatia bacterium]